MAPDDEISGITPTYKFLNLVKEAEDFVANEKKLDAIQRATRVAAARKAKQEAEAAAATELRSQQGADAKAAVMKKTTITSVKGKLTKKLNAIKPKSPTGYKKS